MIFQCNFKFILFIYVFIVMNNNFHYLYHCQKQPWKTSTRCICVVMTLSYRIKWLASNFSRCGWNEQCLVELRSCLLHYILCITPVHTVNVSHAISSQVSFRRLHSAHCFNLLNAECVISNWIWDYFDLKKIKKIKWTDLLTPTIVVSTWIADIFNWILTCCNSRFR